jgi:TatA/E family protein of Tat protein translocase
MFGSIGGTELLVIMVIALLIFGPKKLPELGRSIGKGLSEFKKASNDLRRSLEDEINAEDERDSAMQRPRQIAKPAEPAAEATADTAGNPSAATPADAPAGQAETVSAGKSDDES